MLGLGLEQKMKDGGAKELGENIRHTLIYPFEERAKEMRAQEDGKAREVHV